MSSKAPGPDAVDADALAARWLGYCLRWADRAAVRHPDPVGLYYNAAVDGLLGCLRFVAAVDGAFISPALLDRHLALAGRDATRTERRRASRLRQDDWIGRDEPPGRECDPAFVAMVREEAAREG